MLFWVFFLLNGLQFVQSPNIIGRDLIQQFLKALRPNKWSLFGSMDFEWYPGQIWKNYRYWEII